MVIVSKDQFALPLIVIGIFVFDGFIACFDKFLEMEF